MKNKKPQEYNIKCPVCGRFFVVDEYCITTAELCQIKKLQGNPDPRRLNLLLNYVKKELYNYVVSRKEQRLSVEDKESNKTLKVNIEANINSNYPLPLLEGDIVRHPLKDGVYV